MENTTIDTKSNQTLTRRELLKTGGLVLAGMALAKSNVLGQGVMVEKPKRKIRMGIVGGGFGSCFHWHLDPDCKVEAVSDLLDDRRKFLRDIYKCDKAYNSLEELIKDKNIDAVAVFTGAPDHAKHVIACLEAGKHVICAVPAAMNLEECHRILETVKKTGLTYMMAETSYYHQSAITARKWFKEGKFGNIFNTEAMYHHPGLEALYLDWNGKKTWRYGLPPMLYPTHCNAFLTGVTGERLVEVTCMGWGDDSPFLKDNQYKNPFWNETALFKTNKGNPFKMEVWWKGAHRGTERAQWIGDKMSFYIQDPNGFGPLIVRSGKQQEKDSAGFVRDLPESEQYTQVDWAQTELPVSMRVGGGHAGAEPFLTHEFIQALLEERKPAIDIYEALAYTVPGIVAHDSAMHGGKQMRIPSFDPQG